MTDKVKTSVLAKRLDVSPATIKRLESKDSKFPLPQKIGRDKYFDVESLYSWLAGRSTSPDSLKPDDKIISGARLLGMTNRSKGWLWLNVIKPKALTRINLSPDPTSNKLINYFIEREVYEAFGDLIEVAKGEVAR